MSRNNTTASLYPLLLILLTASCTKMDTAPVNMTAGEYFPVKPGKYITYRLDSTVFVDLNTKRVTKSYIVQDIYDGYIKDNLGRDVLRIRRMIRSNTDTTKWMDNATFTVHINHQRIEYTENNLRFIKLINPVSITQEWNGNSYINVNDEFLRFYANWQYTYDKIDEPYTVNNKIFSNTLTVNHIDKTEGNPSDPRAFYEKTKSLEVYAKGVGLIYKEFLHEFWQPNSASFQTNSYGIKLAILNHNF